MFLASWDTRRPHLKNKETKRKTQTGNNMTDKWVCLCREISALCFCESEFSLCDLGHLWFKASPKIPLVILNWLGCLLILAKANFPYYINPDISWKYLKHLPTALSIVRVSKQIKTAFLLLELKLFSLPTLRNSHLSWQALWEYQGQATRKLILYYSNVNYV